MTLAAAIAEATGLVPGKDFICQDDGAGPYLAEWKTDAVAQPTKDEQDAMLVAYNEPAKVDSREKSELLKQIAMEYLIALIAEKELGDSTRMQAVQAKITAKTVPSPVVDPVTP